MAEIILSQRALADLDEIDRHSIDAFGASVAARYVGALKDALRRLESNPRLAPQLTIVRPPVRALTCGSHRILYDVHGEAVVVSRIVHTARDIGLALAEED